MTCYNLIFRLTYPRSFRFFNPIVRLFYPYSSLISDLFRVFCIISACALRAISYAVSNNKFCCERFIAAGGLKLVFPILMGRGLPKPKKKSSRKGVKNNRFDCRFRYHYIIFFYMYMTSLSCDIMLCCITYCHISLCCIIYCHISLCCILLNYITSFYFTFFNYQTCCRPFAIDFVKMISV